MTNTPTNKDAKQSTAGPKRHWERFFIKEGKEPHKGVAGKRGWNQWVEGN